MLANPAMLQFVGLSPSQITAECHRRIDSLPDGALLRWSFAPLCMAEGCWDIADSIVDLAIQMRLDSTKPLTRAIRTLRRSYERRRQRSDVSRLSPDRARASELDNYLGVEDTDRETFRSLHADIRAAITAAYPGLDDCYVQLLTAATECHAMLTVVFRFYRSQAQAICQAVGLPGVPDQLPPELRSLDTVVLQFCGDKPFTVPTLDVHIDHIVGALMTVQFYDTTPPNT